MNPKQHLNGQSENQQANFKEVETENFTHMDYRFNENQILVQKNAAYINAMKDKKNNVQVDEADERFDLMIRNAQNINARTKMLLEENKPLLRKIFPNKMDKLIAEMERNTIQESMQFRLVLYNLNTQFMLEGMREKYDAALKMIKSQYRSQVASFMMGKLEEMSRDVKNRQYAFIQMIREKNEFLLTMVDIPSTAQRFAVQIEREQDRYFNFLEQLVINFEKIISEELKKFS